MPTQLTGAPCPARLTILMPDTEERRTVRCRSLLDHPVQIHTGEEERPDGSRLVVSWGEG